MTKGKLAHSLGRTKESLAAIHKALLIAPGNLDALRLKRKVNLDSKDFSGAIRTCNEILQVDRRDLESYCDMGLSYEALGMNSEHYSFYEWMRK